MLDYVVMMVQLTKCSMRTNGLKYDKVWSIAEDENKTFGCLYMGTD
jgi:hypothetical protein